MSATKENLDALLNDIVNNRKHLANQVEQSKQSMEVGIAQLAKFDVLIATLQLAQSNGTMIEQIETQAAANAAVSNDSSPTVPASAPSAADAGVASEAA
jgi:cell division septum initiation protein DivIVA